MSKLEQAFVTLEELSTRWPQIMDAVVALREALAQTEPVIDKSAAVRIATSLGWEPKRTWVGLTDEEYSHLHNGLYQQGQLLGWVVDEIEAKLKEKNT